jgi:putative glutamine amidotransferase
VRDPIVVCCESRRKAEPYVRALTLAGVTEEVIRLLTPEAPQRDLAPIAAGAAGLVLCGGPDLEPRWYGEEPRQDANLSVVPELDRMDWELLTGARQGRTPVWAICRGMQVVNAFQGGTLWQDLPSQVPGALDHAPGGPHEAMAHPVRVNGVRDRFGELLGRNGIQVNSRHHQAVRELGRELLAVADSPDGILEVLGLEGRDWWVRGVQWHPENLMHIETQRLLWAEFLRAARRKTSARGEPQRSEVSDE